MRTIKDPRVRKKEFLNTAKELFFTRGYEQTSVDAIIKKIGLSKGSFYYYFQSKEDLLDELTKELSLQILAEIKKIANRDDLDAISKLNRSFSVAANIKLDNIELIKTLLKAFYDDKNFYFRYKLYQKNIDIIAPVFFNIIQQGIKEGAFHTPYPLEASRMIFQLAGTLTEKIPKLIIEVNEKLENYKKLEREYGNYQLAIERILGAPEGSINFFSANLLNNFLRKIK